MAAVEKAGKAIRFREELSVGDAERRTLSLQVLVSETRFNVAKIASVLNELKQTNVAEVLGFASWTAYLSHVYGNDPLGLSATQRQEVTQYLYGEGMSTRAIAPIVGANRKTVMNDIHKSQVVQSGPPAAVVGLDGKAYKPAPPRQRNRSPLPNTVKAVTYDLRRVLDRVERIADDDRVDQHRTAIVRDLGPQILRANELLQRLHETTVPFDFGEGS